MVKRGPWRLSTYDLNLLWLIRSTGTYTGHTLYPNTDKPVIMKNLLPILKYLILPSLESSPWPVRQVDALPLPVKCQIYTNVIIIPVLLHKALTCSQMLPTGAHISVLGGICWHGSRCLCCKSHSSSQINPRLPMGSLHWSTLGTTDVPFECHSCMLRNIREIQ